MAMYKNIVDNTHALNQRMVDLAQGACGCFRCLDEYSVPLNRTNVSSSPLSSKMCKPEAMPKKMPQCQDYTKNTATVKQKSMLISGMLSRALGGLPIISSVHYKAVKSKTLHVVLRIGNVNNSSPKLLAYTCRPEFAATELYTAPHSLRNKHSS